VGWGTLSLINAGLAQSKNRSGLIWRVLSLLPGPIATFLIVVSGKVEIRSAAKPLIGHRRTPLGQARGRRASTLWSPRTRGWSRHRLQADGAGHVIPAHAGVVPGRDDLGTGDRCSPRTWGSSHERLNTVRRCASVSAAAAHGKCPFVGTDGERPVAKSR
jgi:hypothetical protein